jgi:hypothetical protein
MDAMTMLESKYLRSAQFGVDLPKEPILTIAAVEGATEQGDSGEDERWWLLRFREPGVKPLKINNTNIRCLIACFGRETNDWIGKRVQLWGMPGKWFGEVGTAVRIKGADIAQAISVPVKMRAKKGEKRKMVYEIAPLAAAAGGKPAQAKAPTLDPATHVIFKNSPHHGKAISDLSLADASSVAGVAFEAGKNPNLTAEQRARVTTALEALNARIKGLELEAAPKTAEVPDASSPSDVDVKRLAEALDDAGIIYDPARLKTVTHFTEKSAELAAHVKSSTPPPTPVATAATAPAPSSPAAPPAPVDPVDQLCIFGPGKGKKTVRQLDGVELQEHIGLGETKIGTLAPDKRPQLRAQIDVMIAEKDRRENALLGDGPEPGSEG